MARKTGGTFGKSDKLFLGLLVLAGLIAGGFWLWANKPVVVWASFVALVLSIVGVATKAAYEWNQSRADRNLARDDKRAGTALKTSRLETQESAKRRAFVKEERERVALERERLRLARESGLADPEQAVSLEQVVDESGGIRYEGPQRSGKNTINLRVLEILQGDTLVLDKDAALNNWPYDAQVITTAINEDGTEDYSDIAAAMKWVMRLVGQRKLEAKQRAPGAPIPTFPILNVIFDEVNGTCDNIPDISRKFLKAVSQGSEKTQIFVQLLAQSGTAESTCLKGAFDYLRSYATIYTRGKNGVGHEATTVEWPGSKVARLLETKPYKPRLTAREEAVLKGGASKVIVTQEELDEIKGAAPQRQAAGVSEDAWTPEPETRKAQEMRAKKERLFAMLDSGEAQGKKRSELALIILGHRNPGKLDVWEAEWKEQRVEPEPTPAAPAERPQQLAVTADQVAALIGGNGRM
jgi:hypothetical protein